MFVLVVGLVGISHINEQIDSIPGRKLIFLALRPAVVTLQTDSDGLCCWAGVAAQQIYNPADCAAFISCFRELRIGNTANMLSYVPCTLCVCGAGLVVYGVAITKQRVSATVVTLVGTIIVKAIANAMSS